MLEHYVFKRPRGENPTPPSGGALGRSGEPEPAKHQPTIGGLFFNKGSARIERMVHQPKGEPKS